MADELLIKINADAKNVTKAYDDIRKETEDLEGSLSNVSKIGAFAFAALTAEVFFSVKAFEEARESSVQLTNALQNQGIFTEKLKNEYSEYAKVVQAATGIDDDALTKSQAIAQSFLGQTKITQDLTFAIADLGASMGGNLNGAAEKIARTIGTGTNAFAKQGLVISETATEAERMAKVLEFVQAKAGGLAEEMNKADGFSKALATSFGNFQETIGERFAPIVEAARRGLIFLFDAFSQNKVLGDLVVAFIAGGLAISGIVTAVGVAVPAFLALKAAVVALGVSMNVAFLGIPLVIGAVVAGVTLLALNWDKSMAAIKAATVATVTLVSEMFSGLGKVLQGAFNLDTAGIKNGLLQIKDSFKKAKEDAVITYQEITAAQAVEGEKQDAKKKALADKQAAIERQHQANLRAIRQAEIDLFLLQNSNASSELIAIKQKELETLKALDQEKSAAELAALNERREMLTTLEEQQRAEDLEKAAAFRQLQADQKAEFDQSNINADAQMRADRLAKIQEDVLTETGAERMIQETNLKTRIDARNKELLDRKQYGAAYAVINKALNSDEIGAAKNAADSLVALSKSKNSTLKGIGQAAAVTQIGIDTAKGALAVYANFQTAIPFPPVSIPLGIAAATALTLYGAERIGDVMSAADGGLVTGGKQGIDSVPALLMPGELVTPAKNFEEVVGAVRNQRDGMGNGDILAALQAIEAKISGAGTTIINGDVMTDDSYVDSLCRRISDAVEFRNVKIFGVTS